MKGHFFGEPYHERSFLWDILTKDIYPEGYFFNGIYREGYSFKDVYPEEYFFKDMYPEGHCFRGI